MPAINITFTQKGAERVKSAVKQIQTATKASLTSIGRLQEILAKMDGDGAKKARSELEKLQRQLGIADKEAKKLQPALTKVDKALKGIGTSGKKAADGLDKVTDSTKRTKKGMMGLLPHVAAVTLSYMAMRRAARAVASTVIIGVQFEHEMAMVGAIVQANVKNFGILKAAAKEAGEQTVWSAKESATALRFLAMAGFDVGESVMALRATLDLATIGELELKRATDIVTDVLRAFGKEASETDKVVNVFVGTITRSNTNVAAMGQAMKFVAPIAAQLGYSIEEVSAAIGVLSTIGIKAGTAGRSLRMMLLRSADAAELLGAKTTKLNDVLKNLADRKLGTDALAKAVKDLFGLRATPAAL